MKITSPNFNHNDSMPVTYSCDGSDINPALKFEEVDAEVKSLALIMDDPDATGGGIFTHWVIWNIDPMTSEITENSVPESALQGKNDFGKESYGGPCPPAGSEHRYFFKLYALDTILDLPAGATKKEARDAMEGHILTKAELIGRFQR